MLIGLWRFLLHLSVWRILSGTKSLVEMREERWVWGDKKLVMCEKSYGKLNILAKVIFFGCRALLLGNFGKQTHCN
jgi:hypothetical protein